MGVPLDDEERPLHSLPAPLADVFVEAVGGDVRGGDEDVRDGGVEAAQHGEVEQPCALLVRRQVRRHLPSPASSSAAPHHGRPRPPSPETLTAARFFSGLVEVFGARR